MDAWHWLRFHLAPGLGSRSLARLYEAFSDFEELCCARPEEWVRRSGLSADLLAGVQAPDGEWLAVRDRLQQQGVRVVSRWESAYPELLKQIHDPPALLYVRGELPLEPCLAVVGARHATDAGKAWTERLCHDLAEAGIGIVSGLARGIDGAAHHGALRCGGRSWAVLGSGIDRIYPQEHAALANDLERQGGVLSEYPPGTPPLPGHFPGRNRIISGVSRGTPVVEATEKSGSLITAEFALEQGREVFAVPGPVYHPNGAGPNRLLKEGAQPVTGPEDILACFGALPRPRSSKKGAPDFTANQRRVWECLGLEPLGNDEIATMSGLTAQELSDILLHLELSGEVRQYPGMRYARIITT